MDLFLSMYLLLEVINFKSVMKYKGYQQQQKWVFKAKKPWLSMDTFGFKSLVL
jgi:hypothetical protein